MNILIRPIYYWMKVWSLAEFDQFFCKIFVDLNETFDGRLHIFEALAMPSLNLLDAFVLRILEVNTIVEIWQAVVVDAELKVLKEFEGTYIVLIIESSNTRGQDNDRFKHTIQNMSGNYFRGLIITLRFRQRILGIALEQFCNFHTFDGVVFQQLFQVLNLIFHNSFVTKFIMRNIKTLTLINKLACLIRQGFWNPSFLFTVQIYLSVFARLFN